jgi:hypothetical protein
MEESQPKAAARRIIAPWSDGCTKTPLDGGDRKDLQIVGWDDEHRNVARGRAKVPPEGLVETRFSAEKQVICTGGGATSGAPSEKASRRTRSCELATDVPQWLRACPVPLDAKQLQLILLIVGEREE